MQSLLGALCTRLAHQPIGLASVLPPTRPRGVFSASFEARLVCTLFQHESCPRLISHRSSLFTPHVVTISGDALVHCDDTGSQSIA